MRNLLYRRYEAALRRKANGGDMGYGQIAQIGTGLIDDFSKPNQYGVQSKGAIMGKSILSDAATGAELGSVIPGVGTAIGAGVGATVGLVQGFIGGKKAQAQQNNMQNMIAMNNKQQDNAYSQAQLGADPTLATGRQGAQYFAGGGAMVTNLYKNGGSIRKLLMKKADGGSMVNSSDDLNTIGLPTSYGKDLNSDKRTPLTDLITSGGTARRLSSDNAIIKGNSHAEGGIQVPELDAEVEGGETTLNNYVFSKKLGFADLHKPIAIAKGKIENKPRTLERANSMRLLANKENQLVQEQELLKQKLGVQ